MSWLFKSGGRSIGTSVSASVFPMNIQGGFPLGLTGLKSGHESSQTQKCTYSVFLLYEVHEQTKLINGDTYHPKQSEDPTGLETGKRKIPILLEKIQETAMGPDHARLPTAGERQDN